MDRYEKQIGLKTIYLTLARRFHIILLIFIPIALATFLVTNFMMTKTYQSSVTLNRNAVISAAQYQVIQNYVSDTSNDETKPGAIYTTAVNLKENNVKHANGNEITVAEIKSGLSFATLATNSITVSYSFTSSDKSITQQVMNELTKNAVAYLKSDRNNTKAEYANMSYSEASAPTKNSSENKYLLIGLALGAVLALGVPFVYEIVSDQVYDKDDIIALGGDAFTLTVTDKK